MYIKIFIRLRILQELKLAYVKQCKTKWLRRSVANLARSSVLGSSPTVGTILSQANSQLSYPSFRGRKMSTQKQLWGHERWTHIDNS